MGSGGAMFYLGLSHLLAHGAGSLRAARGPGLASSLRRGISDAGHGPPTRYWEGAGALRLSSGWRTANKAPLAWAGACLVADILHSDCVIVPGARSQALGLIGHYGTSPKDHQLRSGKQFMP